MKRKNAAGMAVVLGFALLLLFSGCALLLVLDERGANADMPADWGKSMVSESAKTDEWLNENDVMEGDALPEDFSVCSEESPAEGEERVLFSFPGIQVAKNNLTALTEEYNEKIPFGYRGRSYSYGYFKQESGYKNILYNNCANGLGLDGLGYVIWLYRNALGHTPQEICGTFSVQNLSIPVNITQLTVGDLCITGDGMVDADYGVVCGFADGHPVVSMCDNVPNMKFTYGCNHLSYIRSEHDEILGSYRAVDFVKFFRLCELSEMDGGGR